MSSTVDYQYSVGLICRFNYNFGNNLANYALFQYLSDAGYKTLLIDVPKSSSWFVGWDNIDTFIDSPFSDVDCIASFQNEDAMSCLDWQCEMYVAGSDQMFRDECLKATNYYALMGWAGKHKYKTSYASSFGKGSFDGSEAEVAAVGSLFKNFNHLSIRENSGVDLLKKYWNINAVKTMDPVFLCNRKHYDKMASLGEERIPKKQYIGSYILDLSKGKEELVWTICRKYTEGRNLLVTDRDKHLDGTYSGELNYLENTKNEEWLAMIKCCSFFITDSYHGLCFALIFHKQFCVFYEKTDERGLVRIKELLQCAGLGERLIEKTDEFHLEWMKEELIHYTQVEAALANKISESKQWLLREIITGKRQHRQYMKWARNRNRLFIKKHIKNTAGSQIEVVAYGAGDCFRRNYHELKQFCGLKWVCDSNMDKWGKSIAAGIICISLEQLKNIQNPFVIITIDSPGISIEVAKQLLEMGIKNYDHIENWMKYLEGKEEG